MTALEFDPVRARHINKRGFSSQGLPLHTDRSILTNPPDILAFWCEAQAGAGGETTLADGRTIYRRLNARYPFLIEQLENRDNFLFRSDSGVRPGAVFERDGTDRRMIRLRLDDLLYVSQPLWSWMGVISDAIESTRVSYRMGAGQGYILQNTRWLHGRFAFRGKRRCKRVLAKAREQHSALRSFAV